MLYLFAAHPTLWLYPALATLIILIIVANTIPLSGEAKLLRNPQIIVLASVLWFLTVPFAVVSGVLFLLSKLVGLMIRKE